VEFFTSDHHFGHASIVAYCGRPFRDVDEMNEAMVAAWNSRVTHADTVYHLGDFAWRHPEGGCRKVACAAGAGEGRSEMIGMISELSAQKGKANDVEGHCAKCTGTVYERLWILDDAYNVWIGKCPYCGALNYLGLVGLRGYSSKAMTLVLPTDEEREANGLPPDTPTSGHCGRPADFHGTIAGELQHRILGGEDIV
jgi:hypothetical protein